MTITTPVVTPDDTDTTSTSALHIVCCREDKFLCNAPFHPECKASESDNEDDCCEPCVEKRYLMLCPRQRPTHQHCPFNGGKWCPQ